MSKEAKPSITLSNSSMKMVMSCEQKYFYYKVAQVEKDPDYEESDALSFGKAFHKVLEDSLHTAATEKSILSAMKEFELGMEHKMLLTYMLENYLILHKASGLKVVKCELEIRTPTFLGYADFIAQGPDGWWIGDNKTAARHDPALAHRLHRDYQLNLYSSFVEQIGPALGLEGPFLGFRYRQSIKSKAKTIDGLKKGTPTYEFIIEADALDTKRAWETHAIAHERAVELHEGREPCRNYNACNEYFRTCDWFSRCHGNLGSEMPKGVTILTTENLQDLDLLG